MSSCLQEAQATGAVKTLLQRVRPIAGLTASSHRERSAAERKVVNSILQVSKLVRMTAAASTASWHTGLDTRLTSVLVLSRFFHCGLGVSDKLHTSVHDEVMAT